MKKVRERAKATPATKREHDSQSKVKKVRGRKRETQANEQVPARQVVVQGTAISMPGLRFLDD